jgi:hypothetical protein
MKKTPNPKKIALLALTLLKRQIDAEIKRVKAAPDEARTILLCDSEQQYTNLDKRADDSLGLRTRSKHIGKNQWSHEMDGATFECIVRQVGDNITRRAMT